VIYIPGSDVRRHPEQRFRNTDRCHLDRILVVGLAVTIKRVFSRGDETLQHGQFAPGCSSYCAKRSFHVCLGSTESTLVRLRLGGTPRRCEQGKRQKPEKWASRADAAAS